MIKRGVGVKIMIAAGGTGGHVNPALAVAGEIKKRYPEAPNSRGWYPHPYC